MFDVSREEITEGSLPRALVLLSTPLVAQYFVVVIQQVVDVFWVGRLGENAVAAVGLVLPLVGLAMVPSHISTVGSQVLVSQRVGADDSGAARRVAVNAAVVGFVLQVVAFVLVFLFASDVVGLLGASEAVVPLAVTYLTVYVAGSIPSGVSDALEGGFVGSGDSRAALYVNVTAVVVNAVLDPFLILDTVFGSDLLGVGLGIFGAALASALGFTTGLLLAATMAFRGNYTFSLSRADVSFDRGDVRELVGVGGPSAGQNTARQVARLLVIAIVSFVSGAAGLAAYTVGARIATVAFVPAQGLGQAATSVVGQNLGARKPERAQTAAWLAVGIAAVGLGLVGAVQWFFPATIALLFVPEITPRGLELSTAYLQILAVGYWALGVIYTIEAGFNGAGRTRVSMVSTMLQYWLVRLPIAAVGALVLSYGVFAVFWGVTISNVVAALGLCGYFWYATRGGMLDRAADDAAG
ncbi:MATE family efflux transporter [Halospeciosus flavus]|uniref:Multidrug-efflux transporter n=1 Tax=Halospeciosus flavus TaxID=3032283 RepID=A0ABD5Z6Z2_9EURY|nr:MATE family efflux transporter [Halospeciosus flavus]